MHKICKKYEKYAKKYATNVQQIFKKICTKYAQNMQNMQIKMHNMQKIYAQLSHNMQNNMQEICTLCTICKKYAQYAKNHDGHGHLHDSESAWCRVAGVIPFRRRNEFTGRRIRSSAPLIRRSDPTESWPRRGGHRRGSQAGGVTAALRADSERTARAESFLIHLKS